MKNSTFRHLWIGSMLLASLPLYAQQPSAPPASSQPPASPAPAAPAASQTPAPTTNASSATAATAPPEPSPETLKKAKDLGLHPETHKGVTVYCWEDASIGTRFPTKKCADANQLNDLIAQREYTKDVLRRQVTNTHN